MKKILCLFGFHDWYFRETPIGNGWVQVCKACHRCPACKGTEQ